MRKKSMYDKSMMNYFVKSLNEKGQYALSLHFQKQMMLEEFRRSKEMQKIKDEITNDVMSRISVNIVNTVRKELDKLFLEYQM